MSKKKALLAVLVIVFLILVGFFAVPNLSQTLILRFSQLKNSQQPTGQDQSSVFEDINTNIDPSSGREFLSNKEYSEKAGKFYEIFYALKNQTEEAEEWKNWNWEQTMIYGEIIGVAQPENKVLISVIYPSQSSLENPLSVDVTCIPEETASFYAQDLKYLGDNVSLFKIASVSDDIYTYCLDESCSSIGKSCILVERVL